MSKSNKLTDDSLVKCPMCGKQFIPAIEHYWMIGDYWTEVRDDPVCSYSCMRKWEKQEAFKNKDKRSRRSDRNDYIL